MATKEVGVRLRVGAEGLDNVSKLTGELRRAGGETERFDAAAGELNAELARLASEQRLIDGFRRARTEVTAAGEAMRTTQTRAQALGREIALTEEPTRKQEAAFRRARTEANQAEQAYTAKRLVLQGLREGLTQAGLSSDQLAAAQSRVRTQTAAARQGVAELTQALTAEVQATRSAGDELQRLAAATEQARATLQRADAAVDNYRDSIANLEAPTRQEAAQLASLAERARQAQVAFQGASLAQAQGATAARAAGLSTEQLARAQGLVVAQSQRVASVSETVAAGYQRQGAAAQASALQQQRAGTAAAQSVAQIGQQLQNVQRIASVAIGGTIFTSLIRGVADTADQYANLAARIRLVTGEGEAFERAFEGVSAIAARTGAQLEATGILFARIAQAGREIGISQQQALALTETITQAVVVSGASAEASSAAITQLIQGLQSGVLRGEEFNSVLEQAPRLARALADGLGVTIGQLRALSQEGRLTADVVLEALQGQAGAVAAEFAKLPPTVGRALQNLSNEWTRYIGAADAGNGASAQAAAALNALAANLNLVVDGLFAAGKAYAALKIADIAAGFLRNSAAARAVAVAAGEQATAVAAGTVASRANTVAVGLNNAGLVSNAAALASNTAARNVNTAATAAGATAATAAGAASVAGGAAIGTASAQIARAGAAAASTSIVFRALGGLFGPIGLAIAFLGPELLRLVRFLGETAASWTGVGRAAEEAQLKQRAALTDQIAAAREQADATRQFADVQVLTGQRVLQLTSDQTAAYRAQLEGRLAYEGALLAIAVREQELGQQTAEQVAAAGAAFRATKQALDDLAAGTVAAGAAFDGSLSPKARSLIADFDKLRANGDSAAESIASIGKDFDVTSLQGVRDFGQVLIELQQQGELTAEQVRASFAEALDGEDLLRFETTARAAFAGVQGGAEALAAALDARLREAVQRVGLDFQELETGVSEAARAAINNVNLIADSADELGERGIEVGEVLAAAFDKATEVANTTEALEELRQATVEAGRAGQLTGEQFTTALQRVEAKLRDLDPAFQRLERDAENLGVTLGTDVTRSLEEVVRGYENVRQSGQLSATQLTAAFQRYAADVIEANNGVVPEFLKVEAAAQNVSVGVDEAGRAIVRSLDEGGRSAGRLRRDFDDVRGGVDQLGDSIERLGQRINTLPDGQKLRQYREALTDASGFVLGDDGQRITQEIQPGPPRQLSPVAPGATTGGIGRSTFNTPPQLTGGLTGAQRDEYYNYLVRVGAVPAAFIAAGFTPPSGSERQVAPGGAARSTSAPAPAPAVAPQSQTVRVEISTDGRSRAPIQVASQADASALVTLLRELEQQQRASGIG